MDRNYVYAFKSPYRSCNVVNYSGNCHVNDFLRCFNVWGSNYQMKYHNDDPHTYGEFWFECSIEFFDMLHTETMRRAFERMGVKLVFEYPFMEEFKK